MKNNQLNLDNITITRKTSIDDFTTTNNYRIYKKDNYVSLISLKVIEALGHSFSARVVFLDGILKKITLSPKIEGIESPGYPDEEYQEHSWNYCKKALEECFDNVLSTDKSVEVQFSEGKLYSGKILNGRNIYEGGKLEVSIGD